MKKLFYTLTAILGLSICGLTFADVPISGLPAGTTLGGTEAIPAVQTAVTVKTTPAAINTYVQGQLTSAIVIGKFTGCSGIKYLGADGACHTVPGGGVTSVALTAPAGFSVTGSPITSSGTLGITGTLSPSAGGTGATTLSGVLRGNGTSAIDSAAASDVVSLWSGTCNGSSFLRGDGACVAVAGGATLGANTFTGRQTVSYSNPSIDYYSTSGTSEEHWWRTEVSAAGDTWRLAGVSDNGLTVFDVISATRFHNSIIQIDLAGPTQADDTFSFGAEVGFSTQVSSTAAAGDNDNYNPGGSIGSRTYFRLTADAGGSNITGFQSAATRTVKYLWNVGTVGNIVLKNNAAGSSAGNKILTPGAVDFTVRPGGGWMMIYDGSSSVWRIMSN